MHSPTARPPEPKYWPPPCPRRIGDKNQPGPTRSVLPGHRSPLKRAHRSRVCQWHSRKRHPNRIHPETICIRPHLLSSTGNFASIHRSGYSHIRGVSLVFAQEVPRREFRWSGQGSAGNTGPPCKPTPPSNIYWSTHALRRLIGTGHPRVLPTPKGVAHVKYEVQQRVSGPYRTAVETGTHADRPLGGRLARIVRGSSDARLRTGPGGHLSRDPQRPPATVRVRLGPQPLDHLRVVQFERRPL